MISLKCDVDAAIAEVTSLQEDQLPFIIARSLTVTAQEAQKAVRMVEGQVFQNRNDWTVRNTKITPATKQTLASEVYTDTENRKTGAPDYLAKQEDGGERVPLGGHKYLAIPTRYLWKYTPSSRPLPDNLRPSALLPAGAKIAEEYGGSFSSGSRATGTKRVIGRATLRKLGHSDFVAFLQRTKEGTLCIFVRHGGISYKGGSQDAEPWYTLVPEAHIKPRLHMQETVEAVVAGQFEEIFTTVAAQVGISVKL